MSSAEANALHQQGQYAAASAIYSQLLQQAQDAATRSTILSNRASCAFGLDDPAAAEADCRAGLALNPVSAKLRLKLAKVLAKQDQLAAAAAEVAAAVALMLPDRPLDEALQLYQQLSASAGADATSSNGRPAGSSTGSLGLQLPADPNNIRYLSTAQQLMAANNRPFENNSFIVLAPGTYNLPGPLDGAAGSSGCTILGLGKVVISCRVSHAAWVRQGSLTLINMQLVGSCSGAAVCVSPQPPGGFGALLGLLRGSGAAGADGPGAHCTMIDCRVENYPEAGLLVCGEGAEAVLQGCSFRHCKLHAVEIREGGSVHASNTTIDSCRQGFSAYGGAKRVELYGCTVQHTSKEGVLAAGSFVNAATAAQHAIHNPRASEFFSESAKSATEAAEAWGKQQGQQLVLVMEDCSLQGCGNFGVSIDAGAAARISRCRLESCDPYCVFIKGRSDALITACQFVYAGKSAKSPWAQAYGGLALPAAGVHIGINYAGVVQLFGNAFAGPQSQGVYSETHDAPKADRRAFTAAAKVGGMWSRPPTQAGNSFHARADQLPSLEDLSAKLPKGGPRHDPAGHSTSSSSSSARPVSPAECCRPSSTPPGSSWSPTSCQYYAIGNIAGFNVAAGAPPPPQQQQIRVLLAGCGDIRNLLATVAGLQGQGAAGPEDSTTANGSIDSQQQQQQQMLFVLNDGNTSMLARNAVMLHLIIEQQVPAEVLLAVWANHALSEREHQLLLDSCKALATGPWPDWLAAADSIDAAAAFGSAGSSRGCSNSKAGDGRTAAQAATGSGASCGASGTACAAEAAIRAACAAWAACTVSLPHLLQERDALSGEAEIQQKAVELSLSAVAAAVTGSTNGGSSLLIGSSSSGSTASRSLGKPLAKAITDYIRTGSLAVQGGSSEQPRNQPNMTMLKAPELQYGLYFSSSIFRAVQLQPSDSTNLQGSTAAGLAGSGAASMLLATVGPQIQAVAAAARQGRLQVALLPGDILTVGTAATAASTVSTATAAGTQGPAGFGGLFDFIDTSNVSDYTSLPALLHTCAALLAPASDARLRLESLLAFNRAKLQQPSITHVAWVEAALGLRLSTHELLLGLQLMASEGLPGTQGGVRVTWGPICSSSSSNGSDMSAAASSSAAAGGTAAGSSVGSRLSAVSLFLDLKQTYKRFVESYTGPVAAASSLGGSSSGLVSWSSVGSPTTLVHMLAVAAPAAAGPLTKALLRSAAAAGHSSSSAASSSSSSKGAAAAAAASLFKWELTMHAAISAGSIRSCSQITVPTRPEYRLVAHSTQPHPMLLALSPKPLSLGIVQAVQVKQLFSSFAWDEELAVATLLLPTAVTKTSPAWGRYATLCALSEEGLEAVSESLLLSSLAQRTAPVQPWRGTPQLQRAAGSGGLDCSLLEASGVWGPAGNSAAAANKEADGGEQGWRSLLSGVGEGSRCVVVDLLAPGPIDTAAAVKVAVTSNQLTVTVGGGRSTGKSSSSSGGSSGKGQAGQHVQEGEAVVVLLAGLFGEGSKLRSSTKLSRAMGLLSVRVTAE